MGAQEFTKTCCRCKQPKPLNDFPLKKQNKDGRSGYCCPCKRAYSREWEARKRKERGTPLVPTNKFCTRCGATKPSASFHRNRSATGGLSDYCADCENAYYRERHPFNSVVDLPNEIWKTITDCGGKYAVSNFARVKRQVPGFGTRAGRLIKQQVNRARRGYLTVGLPHGGRRLTRFVHRLVAFAFCEHPDPALDINHKDGNTRNNLPENLEFVTRKENCVHARAVLKVGALKLDEDKIRQIRRHAKDGCLHKNIAAEFRLAQSTVTRIVNRLSWAHVQ